MRKILLASSVCVALLSMAPSQADPGNGCQAAPASADVGIVCTYTATGAGNWFAATPNSYSIKALREVNGKPTTVTLIESESLSPPAGGALASQAGDLITVTMGPDEAGPVAGSIGIVSAFETA